MSCYEWENGTITIPTKELPALHKALRDWQNEFHAEVRAKAIELHKAINTRSASRYHEGIKALENKRYARQETPKSSFFGYREPSATQLRAESVEEAAMDILRRIQYLAARGEKAIHQPTVEDVSVYAPAATNRTKVFSVGEASIAFEKNNVTWDVPENNHAIEWAEKHPLHGVFFGALKKIQWTRGTGGVISGNNEYSREDQGAGGGANYIVSTYGPSGDAAKAQEMGMTLKAYQEMQSKVQLIRDNAPSRRFY